MDSSYGCGVLLNSTTLRPYIKIFFGGKYFVQPQRPYLPSETLLRRLRVMLSVGLSFLWETMKTTAAAATMVLTRTSKQNWNTGVGHMECCRSYIQYYREKKKKIRKCLNCLICNEYHTNHINVKISNNFFRKNVHWFFHTAPLKLQNHQPVILWNIKRTEFSKVHRLGAYFGFFFFRKSLFWLVKIHSIVLIVSLKNADFFYKFL